MILVGGHKRRVVGKANRLADGGKNKPLAVEFELRGVRLGEDPVFVLP